MVGGVAQGDGYPPFLQRVAERRRHVVDAAAFLVAFGAVALDVAFVAVGAVEGDLPVVCGAYSKALFHFQPAHIRHVGVAQEFQLCRFGLRVHGNHAVMQVVAADVLVAGFAFS